MKDLRNTIPVNLGRDYPTRDVAGITHVIVHHSYTRTGSAVAYANFHINEYNWPGIAYHYVIDKNGTVNYTLDHEKVGYHCKGMNRKSVGVCLTGNFDIEDVTPIQFTALVDLLLSLRKEYKWKIGFHNEYSNKTCPGWRFPEKHLLQEIDKAENPPQPEDEYEPDVVMPEPDDKNDTGSDKDDNKNDTGSDKPIVTPPPVNDGRNNPGCLAFLKP